MPSRQGGRIVVENYRADGSRRFGEAEKVYCSTTLGSDGVIRFKDWGYATSDEARTALVPDDADAERARIRR